VPIPTAVLEAYAQYRPTPLVYAAELKKRLGTPAHAYYNEDPDHPGSIDPAFVQGNQRAHDPPGTRQMAARLLHLQFKLLPLLFLAWGK
jgi:hypothetical protein